MAISLRRDGLAFFVMGLLQDLRFDSLFGTTQVRLTHCLPVFGFRNLVISGLRLPHVELFLKEKTILSNNALTHEGITQS